MTRSQFKVLLEGIARPPQGCAAETTPSLYPGELERTVQSMDANTLAGLRDQVILLLGFKKAFWRSELAALNLEDLMIIGAFITKSQQKTIKCNDIVKVIHI